MCGALGKIVEYLGETQLESTPTFCSHKYILLLMKQTFNRADSYKVVRGGGGGVGVFKEKSKCT